MGLILVSEAVNADGTNIFVRDNGKFEIAHAQITRVNCI